MEARLEDLQKCSYPAPQAKQPGSQSNALTSRQDFLLLEYFKREIAKWFWAPQTWEEIRKLKKDGNKLLFPQNLSACSWRIPTSCFARPTHNIWEKTRNPTTIFLVLKLEESFWTENTKPLNFPSCYFSSKLHNWFFSCWQIQAVSPQSYLNTQQIGQGPDSWCGVTPQQCKRRQQEAT